MKLNVGSGPTHFDGFTNVDYDPSEGPDILATVDDIPLPPESVDEILASHILEHVPFWSNAIPEWHRLLCKGGILWVMVPDVISIYAMAVHGGEKYLQNGEWKPLDYAYVNAAVFGGHILGPPWATPGHVHKQIFFGDMLELQLRNFFTEVERVSECPHRQLNGLEICCKATKS